MSTLTIRREANSGFDLRTISNSEASAFTSCERKHYYAYLQKLEPKTTSVSLSRGIIGHEALAVYYQWLKDGATFEDAQNAALQVVSQYMSADNVDTQMLMELMQLIMRYTACYPHNEFREILAVETSYEIPVTDTYKYGMRLDLLVRLVDGSVVLIDHKFVYDFYSDDVIAMNAQVPKYIGTLNFNGHKVDYAILNQIRWRLKKAGNTDAETFKRAVLKPPPAEIRNVMQEQFDISERIIERRSLPPAKQSRKAIRVMNQMVCKNCSFLPICKSELQGADITVAVKANYTQNAYNVAYNPEDAE